MLPDSMNIDRMDASFFWPGTAAPDSIRSTLFSRDQQVGVLDVPVARAAEFRRMVVEGGGSLEPSILWPWDGGQNPAPRSKVEIVLRGINRAVSVPIPMPSTHYRWSHQRDASDIIAYRVVE